MKQAVPMAGMFLLKVSLSLRLSSSWSITIYNQFINKSLSKYNQRRELRWENTKIGKCKNRESEELKNTEKDKSKNTKSKIKKLKNAK